MPSYLLAIIIPFVVIMVPLIIYLIVYYKNFKQHLVKEIDGHKVEIKKGYYYANLIIDDKIVDEFKSYYMTAVKLNGKIDDLEIAVNIGIGFLKPKIITFVNGKKDLDLSNC